MSDEGNPEDGAILPDVYVPRGHMALKEAVIRLAERRRPDMPIRLYVITSPVYLTDPLRTGPSTTDPYAWSTFHPGPHQEALTSHQRVHSFVALVGARAQLREAFAEGELTGQGQNLQGELEAVPVAYWRTDDGGNRLRFTDRLDVYTQVFLLIPAFDQWLAAQGAEVAKDSPGIAPEADTAAPPKTASTKGEVETWKWLHKVLDQHDALSRPKRKYFDEARSTFGVSETGFNRSWKRVTDSNPGLRDFQKPGRKPSRKSPSS